MSSRPWGQALVEFALVIPVMLLLAVGGLDAGRLFFSWVDVNNAAREAAAYAAGNPTDTSGITAHANQERNAQGQAGEGTLAVAVSCANPAKQALACSAAMGGNGTGNTVTVGVTRPFSFVTPFISNLLGNSVTLGGSATSAVYGLQPNGGGSTPDSCDPPSSVSFAAVVTNMTVTVDASASTPNSGQCAIASYAWDWGDGVALFPPSIGKQTSYTYGPAGTYTITLTISNPGGSLTTTQTVTAPPPSPSPSPSATATPSPSPTPTPSPSPTNPCSMTPSFNYTEQGHSGKFNFFGAYTGQPAPSSWSWTYGDGGNGSGQAPSRHTFGGSGPYTVTLLITNGSCQASISQEVTP